MMGERLRPQCPVCPWRHLDDSSMPFTPDVLAAAKAGAPFVCHTRMGPCDGPTFSGVRVTNTLDRDS